jgi:hypothetical protein
MYTGLVGSMFGIASVAGPLCVSIFFFFITLVKGKPYLPEL